MGPTVRTGVILSHLIDSPSTLPDPIAALEVKILDDVLDADSHPDAFGIRLFHNLECYFIVIGGEGVINEGNRVSTSSLGPFGQLTFTFYA